MLPGDLLITILEDYVSANTTHLSALDVAYCNRSMRVEILSVLGRVRCGVNSSCFQFELMEGQALDNHLQWISSRKILLSAIYINAFDANSAAPYLAHCPIKEVHLMKSSRVSADFSLFLDALPYLHTVTLRGDSFCFAHADVLQLSHRQLSTLIMPGTPNVMPYDICEVIVSMCDTLQTLRCDILDDQALIKVADMCVHVKSLSFDCMHISHRNVMVQALGKLGCHLDELEINDKAAVTYQLHLSNDFVVAVAKACPVLSKFTLHDRVYEDNVPECLDTVVAHCPSIVFAKFGRSEFTRKAGAFDIARIHCSSLLPAVFKICRTTPFREIHLTGSNGWSGALLQRVADISAAKLEVIGGRLGSDVTDEVLTSFLADCPMLTTVKVNWEEARWGTAKSLVTANSLSFMFGLCPLISTFEFLGFTDFDDAEFLKVLVRHPAPNLKTLCIDKFVSSEAVLSEVLKTIARKIPSLVCLTIHSTRKFLSACPVLPQQLVNTMVVQAGFHASVTN